MQIIILQPHFKQLDLCQFSHIDLEIIFEHFLPFTHCVHFGMRLEKFALMDFQWCSEVPRGQDKSMELVRGLETSSPEPWLARPCMHPDFLHALARLMEV